MKVHPDDTFIEKQIKRYAEDFSFLYKQEKVKTQDLKSSIRQLMRYSEDINTAYSNLKDLTRELEEAHLDTISRLVIIAEYRDKDIHGHIFRISKYSGFIAENLGMPGREVKNILYTETFDSCI